MSGRRAVAALATAGLLSGCGFSGVSSLPLPGAEATGDDTYRVVVQFDDVLDLVPYSAVKVQDATVGHVAEVRLVDGHAEVVARLRDSVRLPANAVGRVAETSLLGEKYVSLDAPRDVPPAGVLRDGDVVPLERTTSGATVEEVLGALSLVLNGSGLERLRTITTEVDAALAGREDSARSALRSLEAFVAGLDAQKADIVRALEGVERLSGTLAAQDQVLTDALQGLPPAVAVLREQRQGLTDMLLALGRLGDVGTRVVTQSREDLLANLRDLQPVLQQLALAAEDIPKSLDVIATYPFARDVGKYFHGDYGNMWFTINLYGPDLAASLGRPQSQAAGPPGSAPPGAQPLPGAPPPPVPGVPLPGLPGLPGVGGQGGPASPRLPLDSDDAASDIADLLFGGLR